MFCNLMRSTSILAITVALAAPAPALSQDVDVCADGQAPVVTDGSDSPACPEDGAEVAADAEVGEEREAAEALTAADAETDADTGADTGAETTAEADADMREETATETESDPEAGTAATEQAATDESTGETVEDTPATAESVVAEDVPQAETADPVEGGTESTEALPATETASPAENEAVTAEEATEAETAEMAEADSAPEVVQGDTAGSTANANETVETEAAQAAASDTALAETDTVETVTEETSRSSDEEFETRTQASEGRDSGMSDLETFALGALGGAAIATFLNRNNEEVVVSSRDRLVVQDDDGYYRVLKNDDALLRRPGAEIATREFSDGSTRSVVTRQDGTQVVTIRAADGQILRRTRIIDDGRQVALFDDTRDIEPVDMVTLRSVERTQTVDATDGESLRAALAALENPADRRFSLQQIRQIRAVRELMPEIDLDNVNFETGSAVVRPEEAGDLRAIGVAIAEAVEANPGEVFLIEGHTDATGGAAMNLALSDRRAESVALALTEYFDIPPENLVVQGYGESTLKVRTQAAERVNRRVTIRKITPLLYARAGD